MTTSSAKPWIKAVVEYGPIVTFFVVYLTAGLLPATGAIVATTIIATAISYFVEQRIPPVPLFTAVVVTLFGGLTLYLQDPIFIKMKPTIVQLIFAAILLGGLYFGRPLLKPLLQSAWSLADRGWWILSFRFALFFIVMAALNELVWRTQSEEFWVYFKVFGIMLLTFIFTAFQVPLFARYKLEDGPAEGDDAPAEGGDGADKPGG